MIHNMKSVSNFIATVLGTQQQNKSSRIARLFKQNTSILAMPLQSLHVSWLYSILLVLHLTISLRCGNSFTNLLCLLYFPDCWRWFKGLQGKWGRRYTPNSQSPPSRPPRPPQSQVHNFTTSTSTNSPWLHRLVLVLLRGWPPL